MKVLILGCGFIGNILARKFLEKDIEVIAMDNFVGFGTGTLSDVKYLENYSKVLHMRFHDLHGKIKVIRGDVRSSYEVRDVLEEYKPDLVYFLVALPRAAQNSIYRQESFQICVGGLHNVLECLIGKKWLKKIIFSSSSFVYGNYEGEMKETDELAPLDLYGTNKVIAEEMIKGYNQRFGIPYVILRPIAVWGPGDLPGNRVVSTFVQAALDGNPLTVHGDGEDMMSFSYVGDVAEGFRLIGISDTVNEIFNISSGCLYTINDLAKSVRYFFPDVVAEYKEREEHRPQRRGGLNTWKIRATTGFRPVVTDLETGIGKILQSIEKGKIIL